jgi:hypothetical protein
VDVLLILKQMHDDLKGQFAELLHTYYPFQAQEFWRELQPVLKRHEQIEETYVYGPESSTCGALLASRRPDNRLSSCNNKGLTAAIHIDQR